jgi:hypothetical protein
MGTFGTLPPIFPSSLRADIGFEYLRPVFPGRSVTLIIPGGVNGAFNTLAGSGDVSFDFAFIPKLTAAYQFPDLGLGITSSGEVSSLHGSLTRTVDSAAGSANLTATSTLDIGVANLIEGTLELPLDRYEHFRDTCWQDTVLLGTLGMRYSHVSQQYDANLSSGGNSTTLAAHQDWDGFGLTMSLNVLQPLRHDFFLYGVARGSFMLGTNNRNSTLAVVVVDNSAASTSIKQTENETDFIPVGEFELGLGWGKPLGQRARAMQGVADPTPTGPILWIKAGLVADIWGELGLLTPQDGLQGFSNSPLFLYGFTVMAGLEW